MASVGDADGPRLWRHPWHAGSGLGPVLVAACFLYNAGGLGAVAAAFAARPAVLPLLIADGLVTGLALMTFNISQQAIRQAVIPRCPALLRRYRHDPTRAAVSSSEPLPTRRPM